MAKRATISDVAREAGVAKSSVPAVPSNREGVGNAARAWIPEVCERPNYRPSGPTRHRIARAAGIHVAAGMGRMQRTYGLLLAVGLLVTSGAEAIAAQARDDRHTLWYLSPAQLWVEALPVGNGRLRRATLTSERGEPVLVRYGDRVREYATRPGQRPVIRP
jgi:hypothetical protein